jgi:hypothetical protein
MSLLSVGLLAGCERDATGGGSGPLQEEGAQALVDCLDSLGVTAELQDFDSDDGEASVHVAPGEPFVLCLAGGICDISPGGTYQELEDATAAEWHAAEDLYLARAQDWAQADSSATTLFLVGERDLSAEYDACLVESGYVDPSLVVGDPAGELADKQRQVEVNLAWTDCARQHGWPQIKDPDPPVADDWATTPHVLLPSTMTEDELRTLLAACPVSDAAARQAEAAELERLRAEHGDDEAFWLQYWDSHESPLDPAIAFDVPGFDGRWDGGERELVPAADRERLEAMEAMLFAASSAGQAG